MERQVEMSMENEVENRFIQGFMGLITSIMVSDSRYTGSVGYLK